MLHEQQFAYREVMRRKILVNDLMQQGYVYYRTEPSGSNFAPEFRPQLTPKEMLELGVFGGKYMTDCRKEFPASWFAKARLCHERHDPRLNYFGVNASQSLGTWWRNGWIHRQDPRGWFQWYCRYSMQSAVIAIQPGFASGDLLVTKNRVSAFAGRGLELLLGSFLD